MQKINQNIKNNKNFQQDDDQDDEFPALGQVIQQNKSAKNKQQLINKNVDNGWDSVQNIKKKNYNNNIQDENTQKQQDIKEQIKDFELKQKQEQNREKNGNFQNYQKNNKTKNKYEDSKSLFEVVNLQNGKFQLNLNEKCEFQGECKKLLGLCKNYHRQTYEVDYEGLKSAIQFIKEKEAVRKREIIEQLKKQENLKKVQQNFANLWYMVDIGVWKDVVQVLNLGSLLENLEVNEQILDQMYEYQITCEDAFQYYSALNLNQDQKKLFINELIELNEISYAKKYANEFGFCVRKDFKKIFQICGQSKMEHEIWQLKKLKAPQEFKMKMQHLETIFMDFSQIHRIYLINLKNVFLRQYPDLVYSQYERYQQKFMLKSQTMKQLFNNQNQNKKKREISQYFDKQYSYQQNLFIKNKHIFGPAEEVVEFSPKGTYYNLVNDGRIEEKNVYFIDKIEDEDFQYAEKVLKGSQLLGFDSEGQMNGLSLIQISTDKEVFIFDVYKIQNLQEYKKFQQLMEFLIESENIKIVGQDIHGDFQHLEREIQLSKSLEFKEIIDLKQAFLYCYENETNCSLAYITKMILGKNLSKIEQCSGWYNRPLRKSQIHYAALDAFICLKLWQEIQIKFPDLDLDQILMDYQKYKTIQDQKLQNKMKKLNEKYLEEQRQ